MKFIRKSKADKKELIKEDVIEKEVKVKAVEVKSSVGFNKSKYAIPEFKSELKTAKEESKLQWDEFVEEVILGTLNASLDRVSEYVNTVLAEELKNSRK